MLKLEPFEMHHLDYFSPSSFEGDLAAACAFCLDHPRFRQLVSVLSNTGEIIALAGSHYINRDCVEVFLIPSQKVKKHAKALVRTMMLLTDVLLNDVCRVQFPVLPHNRKWATAIGFEYEGVVKKYFGSEDHFMYIKTRS